MTFLRMPRFNGITLALVASLGITLSGCPSKSTRIDKAVVPRQVLVSFDYGNVAPSYRLARPDKTREPGAASSTDSVERRPEWAPRVPERRWAWIFIHHSATDRGNAAIFGRYHRDNRRWDELGYHFVIGNGTDSSDGRVEVGSRWRRQKWGAHCKVPMHEEYNQVGIGICLVGNFDKSLPSIRQLKSVTQLVSWLVKRYNIPRTRVLRHGDVKDTDCPGMQFPFDALVAAVFAQHRLETSEN